MSEYRVNLDIFAGPLDLLLYLVRRDEVDIYDIPIARITEEYIRHVEMIKMLDIDLAGDFLVMAATLMEIKSAMLLPRAETEEEAVEEAADPRIELVRQLLEYKKFKDAANLLELAADCRSQRFARPGSIIASLKKTVEPEVDLDQVSVWTLLEAFDEIMKATGRLHSYDHIKDDTPIDLYQIEVLHRLQEEGPLTLEQVFTGRGSRLVLVGLFLAVLELIRSQLVWAEQPGGTGPIYLRSLTNEPAEEAVQKAIYAAAAAEEAEKAAHEHEEELEVEANEPFDGEDEEADERDEYDEELDALEPGEIAEFAPRVPIREIAAPANTAGQVNDASEDGSDADDGADGAPEGSVGIPIRELPASPPAVQEAPAAGQVKDQSEADKP